MENLYKVEEYSGKLPNPKSFPVSGATISAIKGRPCAFSDGFMLDLSVRDRDKRMLVGRVVRTVDTSSIIEEAEGLGLLLSEPEFIYDTTYLTYIVFTPKGNPIGIQVKYYKYFRNRYPECKFYIKDEGIGIITIKVLKEVVGKCMPIFLDWLSITKIMEERK